MFDLIHWVFKTIFFLEITIFFQVCVSLYVYLHGSLWSPVREQPENYRETAMSIILLQELGCLSAFVVGGSVLILLVSSIYYLSYYLYELYFK